MINAIFAIDDGLGFGRSVDLQRKTTNWSSLPWGYMKEDLKSFYKLTKGHTVAMGRETLYTFIVNGKFLEGRKNIVFSKMSWEDFKKEYETAAYFELAEVWGLEEYFKQFFYDGIHKHKYEEVFIIGGISIFEQTHHLWERVYMSRISGVHECDILFPKHLLEYIEDNFQIIEELQLSQDVKRFTYERNTNQMGKMVQPVQ